MRWRLIATFALLALGVVLATAELMAPKDGEMVWRADGRDAYGIGYTHSRSYGGFDTFLNENPDVQRLVMMRMPGTQDLAVNTKIARLIRDRGLATHLTGRSYIASGAVDLFLAGAERTMDCGARIGVHQWSLGDPRLNPDSLQRDDFEGLQKDFLRDMGIDPSFYDFTRAAAPPDGIYILTMEDIRRFDLLTEYPDCG